MVPPPLESTSLEDFIKWNPPPLKEILGNGILYEGGKIIIYGRYKTFKSMLTKSIGLCIAYGIPFQRDIPIPKEGASVYYLQAEIGERLLHKRVKPMVENLTQGFHQQKQFRIANAPGLILDEDQGLWEFEQEIDKHRPEVVIIDPLYRFMRGSIKDSDAVAEFLRRIDMLISKYNFAVILVHHTRKRPAGAQSESDFADSDDILGAQTLPAWADGVIRIQPKGGDSKDNITLQFREMRHAETEIPNVDLFFNRQTLQFHDVTIKL